MLQVRGVLCTLLAVFLLFLGGAGIAGAAPKMVIDRSHGQTADLSGFTSVLVSRGWEVDDQTVTLTTDADVLNACNLLVVPQPVSDFTDAEVAVVRAYVEAGGGLWVLYDVADPHDPYAILPNSLPTEFGVAFDAGMVLDLDAGRQWTDTPVIAIPDGLKSHPLFTGVSDFAYLNGISLSSDLDPYSPPSLPVVVKASVNGMTNDYGLYWSEPPVLAASEVGTGHVLFIGDSTPLAASVYSTLSTSHKKLLDNIVAWVMKPVPPEEPTTKEEEPTTKEVTINLRPWNPHNKLNLDSKGFIRVAIMSDSTFDAANVNPTSVKFAGGSPVCSKLMNVNRDHKKDLVLVLWIPDLKDLTCDSVEAVLTGKTKDGKSIQGSDSVRIVPSKKCKKPAYNGKDCGGNKGK